MFFFNRNLGVARSPKWRKVSKQFKKGKVCAVCGAKLFLVVHHIFPCHLYPDRELDKRNLIVLCGWRKNNCHFIFGHYFNFSSFNKNIKKDAKAWKAKIKNRP